MTPRATPATPSRQARSIRRSRRGALVLGRPESRLGSLASDRRGAGESGQASIELVMLAPLLALVVFAAAQLLAAGAAGELADHAAEAAAVAVLQGADPAAAARDAVPGWSRDRMTVRIDGRHVHVSMRPPSPIPALANALESSREADAGPVPR